MISLGHFCVDGLKCSLKSKFDRFAVKHKVVFPLELNRIIVLSVQFDILIIG